MRGVKIDVVQIVVAGGEQDHAAFSAPAFPRSAGNGLRFQGAELVSLIGAAPTATDDVCSVFDAVIEHLVGGAHRKRRTAQGHKLRIGRRAHDARSVSCRQGHTRAGGAVGVAHVALLHSGRLVPKVEGLVDFVF